MFHDCYITSVHSHAFTFPEQIFLDMCELVNKSWKFENVTIMPLIRISRGLIIGD